MKIVLTKSEADWNWQKDRKLGNLCFKYDAPICKIPNTLKVLDGVCLVYFNLNNCCPNVADVRSTESYNAKKKEMLIINMQACMFKLILFNWPSIEQF